MGGIVGLNRGNIKYCCVDKNIINFQAVGYGAIGNIVGKMLSGNIEKVFCIGELKGSIYGNNDLKPYIGGLIGVFDGGIINGVYFKGNFDVTPVSYMADKYGNGVTHYLESGEGDYRTGFKNIQKDGSGNYIDDPDNNGYHYGTFASLLINDNKGKLPINNSTKTNTHFTPVWFPNSEYVTRTVVYDIWTPAGMLSQYVESNPIVLEDNMYDDYYIKPGK